MVGWWMDGWAVRRPGRIRAWGRATIGLLIIGSCLGPALWAEVAAQALNGCRAVPALSTIDRASDRVGVVFFRVVPRAVNRARPIWNSIAVVAMLHACVWSFGCHVIAPCVCVSVTVCLWPSQWLWVATKMTCVCTRWLLHRHSTMRMLSMLRALSNKTPWSTTWESDHFLHIVDRAHIYAVRTHYYTYYCEGQMLWKLARPVN
jgi:hypothetical protein